MFDGVSGVVNALMWLCIIFIPLGLWKAIEIVWWLFSHTSISIG